jgi:hypothetical protein
MQTRAEMETELQRQLQAASNSTLFPSTRLTELIKNAYKEATTLFKWLALARAKITSTTVKGASDDDSYYDYPEEFRTNTIFRVEIDGKEYNRKGFESFRDYRNRNPNSTKRIFANYQRFLFISPDTTAGTDNMDVWGIIQAPELSSSSTETIFSGNNDAGNMAVVGLALSTAVKKIDPKLSEKEKADALGTLLKMNSDEWAEYARDQQLDTPLFEVPDFFGKPNINAEIGQFYFDPTEHY